MLCVVAKYAVPRVVSGISAVALVGCVTPHELLLWAGVVLFGTCLVTEEVLFYVVMEAWALSAQLLTCNRLLVGSRLFHSWSVSEISQIFASAEIGRSLYLSAMRCLPCVVFKIANVLRLVLWALLVHVFLVPAHWHHQKTMAMFFAVRSNLRWMI